MSQKTRVLIIDDDAVLAKNLSSYLSRRSFEVSLASSSPEALRIFRTFDPVIVVLDMSMTGMTGSELIQRLKEIKPSVAVVVLSANNDPELICKDSNVG